MRALNVAVVVMGVLIVLGTAGLVVGIARRSVAPTVPPSGSFAPVVLDEPEGTRIAGIAAVSDRLALRLAGGGADRVVLVNTTTGTVAGRVSLAR